MMVNNAIRHISDSQEKTSKLQTQISTGKQFQNASEDPVNASLGLSLRSNLRTVESYVNNAENTNDWMLATDYVFTQLETVSTRATNLVMRGLNDSLNNTARVTSLGTELQTLIDQAVEAGNTKQNDQYIFSGYKVDTKPFSLVKGATFLDTMGNTVDSLTIDYSGDTNAMQRRLGPDQLVTMNVPGTPIETFIASLIKAKEAMIKDPYNANSLQTAMAELQSSLDTLSQYRTSNGARMRQVESAADFLAQVTAETKSLLSKKEDTNMAEAIASLSNQKVTFEAVLDVSQRAISGLSLFDYLK